MTPMQIWRHRNSIDFDPDPIDWLQVHWPCSTWPRIRFWRISLELRYLNPGIIRRNYRHDRRCGFHRWESVACVAANTLGIWWTMRRPLRRIYAFRRVQL